MYKFVFVTLCTVVQVLKALGKGSYGTVYKVQRLADDGVYAMKETDMGRMGPKERADAVNEIRVLGSINHPNVVRHHETFLSGKTKWGTCHLRLPVGSNTNLHENMMQHNSMNTMLL
jgi:serine/threonine protein kinase